MRKLLTFLLLCSALSHAGITIVQEKHTVLNTGSGNVAFAVPTTNGNSVIVLRAFCSTDPNHPIVVDTDDAGNLYNSYQAATLDNAGKFCHVEIFAAFSSTLPRTPYATPMQTLTVTQNTGTAYVLQIWMLEISGLSPGPGNFPTFLTGRPTPADSITAPPTTTSILAPLFPDAPYSNMFNDQLFLALAAPQTAGVTAVSSPWTLLTA